MNVLESLPFFKAEIVLLLGAVAVLFSDFMFKNKKAIGILALGVLCLAAWLAKVPEQPHPLFYGFFILDKFTHFFRLTALGILAVTVLISLPYERIQKDCLGEYYCLLLFAGFGLILMAAASNLLMIFLAIEFVSLVSYLLVGFLKQDERAKEASLKYLLFGSLASGIMLYGMSILFGITGSLELGVISQKIAHPACQPLAIMALLLMFAGLGFKISMAPFHMWAPDVYEGAPTPITAFLSVGPKALGFAVMIRILTAAFGHCFSDWTYVLFILSVMTMTLGNITAIAQTNIKRLLAYSSIAQAGYMLMGITVFSATGLQAVLFYLIAYAITNLGAFVIVIAVSRHHSNDHITSYAGLARQSPLLAASLAVFLLSLTGMPPLAGFVGKFYIFAGAIEAGYVALAIWAIVNSGVAAFYYFNVIRTMYLAPSLEKGAIAQPISLQLALFLTLAGTILLGLIPSPLLAFLEGILPG